MKASAKELGSQAVTYVPTSSGVVHGLTLRADFAARALQGMLSSDMSTDRTKVNKKAWAKAAVEFANALLEELSK